MKKFNLIILFVIVVFTVSKTSGQANALINILSGNGGIIGIGGTENLQVSISNSGPSASIGIYKIKVTITVPNAIGSIPATGHILPIGWTITSNDGTTLKLSNGTDIIPVSELRNIFIAIKGIALGGPSTIFGSLAFSNGVAPGTGFGALTGDLTGDNNSTTTITVTTVTPVKLTNFTAQFANCKPVLNWITESEINSDRFEIERATQNPTDWFKVGNANAQGNSAVRNKYNFSDVTVLASTQKVFYRLKMIDNDGQFKYSPIVPVFINCKTMQINTYPNPVQTGLLNVNIITINNEKTEAVLMSAAGQVVLKMNLKNGLNTVNVSNIANGEYLLKVNAINSVSKVLIQNKK